MDTPGKDSESHRGQTPVTCRYAQVTTLPGRSLSCPNRKWSLFFSNRKWSLFCPAGKVTLFYPTQEVVTLPCPNRKWLLSPVLPGHSFTLQEEGERGRKKGRKERTGVDIASSQPAASKRFWKDLARCTGDAGDPYSVHITHICPSLLPWEAA